MRRWVVVAALALPTIALASCGDDDDDGDSEASTSIEATASEFQFEPDSWTVPAGEEFSVDLTNDGTVAHEWAVIKLGQDLGSEKDFEEDKILFEIEGLPAGESTTEQFTIDEPGDYQVICGIESHFDAGMEGTLTVE
ncbi:MAG TPA: cupredoxin domain-containing protein [Acidimicrobiales bacterium]|jgi:plastocyanin|nr:cupredoxin domain-containing protein [Acidimicrobiales bacterium]